MDKAEAAARLRILNIERDRLLLEIEDWKARRLVSGEYVEPYGSRIDTSAEDLARAVDNLAALERRIGTYARLAA